MGALAEWDREAALVGSVACEPALKIEQAVIAAVRRLIPNLTPPSTGQGNDLARGQLYPENLFRPVPTDARDYPASNRPET